MAGTQQFGNVLLLGASGKLGRMVRTLWRSTRFSLLPVVRSNAAGERAIQWAPGAPPPAVGNVAAVVALWGVTPGAGRDLSQNTELARAAIGLGEALGAGVVLHCSSAAVYRPSDKAIPERVSPDPVSSYGRAKLDMERAVEKAGHNASARQICLRIGNVAGADSLFGNLQRGKRIILDRFADGSGPARSYLAPGDLVRVIQALISDPSAQGVYNVAAPRPTEMAAIAHAWGAETGWRTAPESGYPLMWLDTTRLSDIIRLDEESADAGILVEAARAAGAG